MAGEATITKASRVDLALAITLLAGVIVVFGWILTSERESGSMRTDIALIKQTVAAIDTKLDSLATKDELRRLEDRVARLEQGP